MADLFRFFFTLCIVVLLAFVQGTRFLSLGGVNPNLIFIFFSGLMLAPHFRDRISRGFFAALLALAFIMELLVSGIWLVPWVILFALILAVYFLRDFFTGRPFPDFLLVLALGTPVFYGLNKLALGGVFSGGFVLKEILYNFGLGLVFWGFLRLIGKTRI
jgi:hypothetical protein